MQLSARALERFLVCFAAMMLAISVVQAVPVPVHGSANLYRRNRLSDFLCDFIPFGGSNPLGGVERGLRQHDTRFVARRKYLLRGPLMRLSVRQASFAKCWLSQ